MDPSFIFEDDANTTIKIVKWGGHQKDDQPNYWEKTSDSCLQ